MLVKKVFKLHHLEAYHKSFFGRPIHSISQTVRFTTLTIISINVQDAAKTSAHSKLLTDKETVYQIVSDTVAPKDWEDYVAHKAQLMQRANDTEGIRWEHCASWHFRYGDVVFRAMHLIKFDGVSVRIIHSGSAQYFFDLPFNIAKYVIRHQSDP